MLTDTAKGYGIVSIALHWLVAGFIAFLYISGEIFSDMGRTPEAAALRGLHQSVGVVAAVFFCARFVWRLWQGAQPKGNENFWLNLLAILIQWALLIAMLGAMITGFLAVWSGGRDISVFGLFSLPTPMAQSEGLHEFAEDAHEFFSHVILPLVALHVLGALKHLIINRDGVMKRIFVPVRG